jgi:prevent-host-death family protein
MAERGSTVMTKTLKASEAREQFSQLLNQVFRGEARVLVEKSGIPVAGIISARDLERFNRYEAQRERDFSILDEIGEAFKDVSAEEIKREVARALAQVRAKRQPKPKSPPARELESDCRVCGKAISDPKSMHRGIGQVCYSRIAQTLSMTDDHVKEHLEKDTDEKWTALIERLREEFNSEVPVREIPDGYITMSSFCREAEQRGLTARLAVRACGGDRAVGPVLDERFQCVYVQVGNRLRKYLPAQAMTDEAYEAIQATQKPRKR